MNRIRGTNCTGCADNVEKLPSSRRMLPHEGMGSLTPSPKMPRFASVKIKTGTEIQNCANRIGFRFGRICRHKRRNPWLPEERAIKTKSEFISPLTSEQMTRAAPAQPKQPSMANVIATEVNGETFRGNTARTVISRNSHGSDKRRSVPAIMHRSTHPPTKPANAPASPASRQVSNAAAGASKSDTRVPYKTREKRSRPRSSVPRGCCGGGGAWEISRYGGGYEGGAMKSASRHAPATTSRSPTAIARTYFMTWPFR